MDRYEGEKVVIIGGTSGMGPATAKMLLDGKSVSPRGMPKSRDRSQRKPRPPSSPSTPPSPSRWRSYSSTWTVRSSRSMLSS